MGAAGTQQKGEKLPRPVASCLTQEHCRPAEALLPPFASGFARVPMRTPTRQRGQAHRPVQNRDKGQEQKVTRVESPQRLATRKTGEKNVAGRDLAPQDGLPSPGIELVVQ